MMLRRTKKIKSKDFKKNSCFVDSFIKTWALGSDLCK
jgi:hypothetical protein